MVEKKTIWRTKIVKFSILFFLSCHHHFSLQLHVLSLLCCLWVFEWQKCWHILSLRTKQQWKLLFTFQQQTNRQTKDKRKAEWKWRTLNQKMSRRRMRHTKKSRNEWKFAVINCLWIRQQQHRLLRLLDEIVCKESWIDKNKLSELFHPRRLLPCKCKETFFSFFFTLMNARARYPPDFNRLLFISRVEKFGGHKLTSRKKIFAVCSMLEW